MMDTSETTRLRALLKGIALPWKAQPTVVDGDEVECLALVLCPHGDDGDRDMVAEIDMGHGVECDDAHAALIVAAVNALPGLLDAAERAERELATATASVRQLRADVELATAQRDAETCRADNAECERDDLAATLETRTAEHALAMEQLAAVTAERDVALGQQAPLLDAHDALVAAARAAGWTGAGATGEELVAWVRRGGACEGAVAVLLRYAGGEVYALARCRVGRVWSLTIAGVTLKCVMHVEGDTIPDGAWLRVKVDLATFAATPAVLRRVDVMTAARVAAEAAEHARVALEMERAPQRPTKAKRVAKRTGKGKAKR